MDPASDVKEPVAAENDAAGAAAEDKKKKKKKKPAEKPKVEEKAKAKPKGLSSKKIAEIKALQEEQERIRREQEELANKEEEAENERLEKVRLEAERKQREKDKKKQKIADMKAAGLFKTNKQKEQERRAQASLEAMKAQGFEVPVKGAEKKPRFGSRVRPKKLQTQTSTEENSASNEVENQEEGEPRTEEETKEQEVPEEKIKDAWDEESSDEEEAPSETNDVAQKVPAKAKAAQDNHKAHGSGTSDSDEDSDGDSESDDEEAKAHHKKEMENRRERAELRIAKRREENEKKRNLDDLRAPVVCVLGHVDTGKTKILDKLRRTNVQDGEAGGITQQIGATNVPIDAVKKQSELVHGFTDMELKIPGLLIIDTPGHESFSNLRSRGSSVCDIAILVVDIMHGLEPQTIESLNLLKSRKTPFVVALNKIDRLYDWQSGSARKDIRDILKTQPRNTMLEFDKRTKDVIVQFAEQGLNAALFHENPDPKNYISLVPTSAITGDGMGNLMAMIVEFSQKLLAKRLMFSEELQAVVLEVKALPGLGTTIDIILINGRMREGETLILAGTDGPLVTQIRSLLTPQPMKELRVKNAYIDNKEIKGALGVKVAAKDLEKAIAGLNCLIAYHPDEEEICKDEVAKELRSALSSIKLAERGVYVQASTLGSLEALLEFLKTSKIPYSNIRIGPVVKKDVMKASVQLEHDSQYAVILAFDVKVERDAQELADSLGVRIFRADIIYHLFDSFIKFQDELAAKKKEQFKHVAVFPCKMKILPQFVFNSRDPIVVGVMIEAGILREGTPICVPSKEFVELGRVTSIEVNHKAQESARKGQEVCIKIEPIPGDTPKLLGRHFEITDMMVSKISRESIDACKDYFRSDLQKSDWQLMVELKKLFEIL